MEHRDEKELYLYAIVPAGSGAPEGLGRIGLYDEEVELLPAGGKLAAVVSAVPEDAGDIRPERRNLSAHQKVVSALSERGEDFLPVSFGTVSPSAESLRDLVAQSEADLMAQLDKVAGAVEREVRIELNVSNVFEHFVSTLPELKEARDRLFGEGRVPSRDEKIELGKLFEELLEREREKVASRAMDRFSALAEEVKRDEPRNEREVARVAVLLPRSRQAEFDQALEGLAGELDDRYTLFVTGPLPAYNFVDVHLRAAA